MTYFDEAHKKFKAIAAEAKNNMAKISNEAETRFQLIDRILKEVLGWDSYALKLKISQIVKQNQGVPQIHEYKWNRHLTKGRVIMQLFGGSQKILCGLLIILRYSSACHVHLTKMILSISRSLFGCLAEPYDSFRIIFLNTLII